MLIFSTKIHEAINLATEAHSNQKRKISGAPYIIHPLSVGLILARVGASEEVIIAGILHDVLEDSKMQGLKEIISEKFGEKTLKIVQSVTEKDKKLSWKERKQAAIEHIPEMSREALLIKSADVLHNTTDLIFRFQAESEKVFEHFNASKEEQIERYVKLIAKLKSVWLENPLLSELKQVLKFFKHEGR